MARQRAATRVQPNRRRAAQPAGARQASPASRPPAGSRAWSQRPRRFDARSHHRGAQRQLQRFRRGSVLAVALTALLLMIWGVPLEVEGEQLPEQTQPAEQVLPDPTAAIDEATNTIRELAYGFYAFLPRLVIVLGLLALATLIARAAHAVLGRTLRGWERREAVSALARLVIFLVAVVASLSVLAGDVRAVVGSVGLLGLAASWALQTPIESFTGWLLNSFRGYYRVGDRIAVGEVFGDVYRIDVLTTTVWEAGGQGKPVAAAQATGALITFPNWEVLRANVVNYSRDFPYVWDEITINVANESDLAYTASVLEAMARRVMGDEMASAAEQYQALLAAERLAFEVEELPRVFLSLADAWTDCTIRYLVPVRTRRRWASALVLAAAEELAKPEHRNRILPVYPRTEVVLHQKWPSPREDGSANGMPEEVDSRQATRT